MLERIRDLVHSRTHLIPAVVERVPIMLFHADSGPHNIIVGSRAPSGIQAVIDWEFVSSGPFCSAHRILEMLFRKPAINGFGQEHDRTDELRKAFWDAIPE